MDKIRRFRNAARALCISAGVLFNQAANNAAGAVDEKAVIDSILKAQQHIYKYNTPYFDSQARVLSVANLSTALNAINVCPNDSIAMHASIKTAILINTGKIKNNKNRNKSDQDIRAVWRSGFMESTRLILNPESIQSPKGNYAFSLSAMSYPNGKKIIYNEVKCFNEKGEYSSSEQEGHRINTYNQMLLGLAYANLAADLAVKRSKELVDLNNEVYKNGFFKDNRYKLKGKFIYPRYNVDGMGNIIVPVYVDAFQLPLSIPGQVNAQSATWVMIRFADSGAFKILISEIMRLQSEYNSASKKERGSLKYREMKKEIFKLRDRLDKWLAYSLVLRSSKPIKSSYDTVQYPTLFNLFSNQQACITFGAVPDKLKGIKKDGTKVCLNTKMR